jgi:hypothetical protein
MLLDVNSGVDTGLVHFAGTATLAVAIVAVLAVALSFAYVVIANNVRKAHGK